MGGELGLLTMVPRNIITLTNDRPATGWMPISRCSWFHDKSINRKQSPGILVKCGKELGLKLEISGGISRNLDSTKKKSPSPPARYHHTHEERTGFCWRSCSDTTRTSAWPAQKAIPWIRFCTPTATVAAKL